MLNKITISNVVFLFAFLTICAVATIAADQVSSDTQHEYENGGNQYLSELKANLDEYYNTDYFESLLMSKEMMDSFLSPYLLLLEFSDGVPDWVRMFRYSYDSDDLALSYKCDADKSTVDRICSSLASIKLPVCDIRSRFMYYDCQNYPFTIQSRCKVDKDTLSTSCCWYEPMLVNRDCGLSIFPDDKYFSISPREFCFYKTSSNKFIGSREIKAVGKFNVGVPSYSIGRALDPRLFADNGIAGELIGDLASEPGPVLVELLNSKKNVLRSSELFLENGLLNKIRITQTEFSITNIRPYKFSQARIKGREVISEEISAPASGLRYPRGGRSLEIAFRTYKEANLPSKLSIRAGNELLFTSEYVWTSAERVINPVVSSLEAKARNRIGRLYQAFNSSDTNWEPNYYNDQELGFELDGRVLRTRLKYNIYASVLKSDRAKLDSMLMKYRSLLEHDGLAWDNYIYSLECLTQMSHEFVDSDMWQVIACEYLKDAYSKCSTSQLMSHLERTVKQCRFGYSVILLREIASRNDSGGSLSEWAVNIEKDMLDYINTDHGKYLKLSYVYLFRELETAKDIIDFLK